MKLREWDWNAQAYVEVEYPDEPVKRFVDWFRTTKQWREDPEQVFGRWMKFERELQDARADADRRAREVIETDRCTATTAKGEPCKGKAVRDGLCMSHLKAAA